MWTSRRTMSKRPSSTNWLWTRGGWHLTSSVSLTRLWLTTTEPAGKDVHGESGEQMYQDKVVGWVQPAVLWHNGEGSLQEADSEGDGKLLRASQLHHHCRRTGLTLQYPYQSVFTAAWSSWEVMERLLDEGAVSAGGWSWAWEAADRHALTKDLSKFYQRVDAALDDLYCILPLGKCKLFIFYKKNYQITVWWKTFIVQNLIM